MRAEREAYWAKVEHWLKKHDSVSTSDLRRIAGISDAAASSALGAFEREKRLERFGVGSGTRYRRPKPKEAAPEASRVAPAPAPARAEPTKLDSPANGLPCGRMRANEPQASRNPSTPAPPPKREESPKAAETAATAKDPAPPAVSKAEPPAVSKVEPPAVSKVEPSAFTVALANRVLWIERGAFRVLTWIVDAIVLAGGGGLGYGICRVSPMIGVATASLLLAGLMLWKWIPRHRAPELIEVASLVGSALRRVPSWIGAAWKNRPRKEGTRDWGRVAVVLLVATAAALLVSVGRPLGLAAGSFAIVSIGLFCRRGLLGRLKTLRSQPGK